MVAAMLVEQGDDGLDVSSLDDVQCFGALDQDAVQDLKDAWPCARGSRKRKHKLERSTRRVHSRTSEALLKYAIPLNTSIRRYKANGKPLA